MTRDRLLTWSRKSSALVPLVPLGVEGGQTALYVFASDPDMLAGTPVPGEDPARYFAKIDAMIDHGLSHPNFAFPVETLVSPRDKKTPLAFSMKRLPGKPLEELLYKAEREALGLDWGLPEWLAVAREVVKLFAYSDHHGFTQNDTHPGQYLVDWHPQSLAPRRVSRVDALAFGFWHMNVYHSCDKARWEYVPPELQWLGRRQEGLKGCEMPREADRFGLACLLFEFLTGGKHTDYAGGHPDPAKRVEKKEFAVLSMPPGAKVPDDNEAAYFSLPVEVTTLFERSLLGDPIKRPTPSEWQRVLKAVPVPRTKWFLPQCDPASTIRLTTRQLLRAARNNAARIVGVASLVGAIWLLPSAEPGHPATGVVSGGQTARDPKLEWHTPSAARPVNDSLPTLPPPTRQPKDPRAHEILLTRK